MALNPQRANIRVGGQLPPTLAPVPQPRVMAPTVAPAQAAPAAPAAPELVKVRCIAHTFPWTHEKPLSHGDETSVPADVAAIMIERAQVEKVEA